MKISITFKNPDAVYEAVRDAVRKNLPDGLSGTEKELIEESRIEDADKTLETWIKYSEYVTVEFDLEANQARVVPAV